MGSIYRERCAAEMEGQCSKEVRDFVNKIKSKKELPGHNPPPYMDEDVWQNWLKYWDLEDVKTKSNIARRCRMSEPAGPGIGIVKHKGGSKSALQYAEELALERDVEVKDCIYEAYAILHMKKDGTYTDEKSAMIGREVQERSQQLSQPLPGTTEPQEVNLNEVYMDVVGISSKNIIFGGGEIAKIVNRTASTSTTGTAQFHSQEACDSRYSTMEEKIVTY